MPRARVRLDWSDPRHYGARALPCRRCGSTTNMRDGQDRPCHKECAETELAAQIVAQPDALFRDESGA